MISRKDRSAERAPKSHETPTRTAHAWVVPWMTALALVACGRTNGSNTDPAFVLTRTDTGIATITAPTLAGAASGLGYAYAQDNYCLLQEHLLTLNGERSKYLGPDALLTNFWGPTHPSTRNLDSDVWAKLVLDSAYVDQLWEAADPDSKALVGGWVEGFNRYVDETPRASLDASCRDKPWLRRMTVTDLRKELMYKGLTGGIGNFLAPVALAQPPPVVTGTLGKRAKPATKAEREAEGRLARFRLPESPVASNGWAFGRDVLEGADALSFANPHFPVDGPQRIYQAHITVPGVMDVVGITWGAMPVVVIGYNESVAWTHPASPGKRFTLYELTLKNGDPLTYVVDGVEKAMTPVDVTVEVLDATGPRNVTRRLYETDFGFVLSIPSLGLGWSGQHAYAIRDANLTNNRYLKTWLKLLQATSVRDMKDALSADLGVPFVNTIAADSTGEVMFADIGTFPNVDSEDVARCMPSAGAAQLLPVADLLVLRGDAAACQWKTEAGSPEPGLMPASKQPFVFRTDWVASSNDSPWLANPDVEWPPFSTVFGPVHRIQRPRTRSGIWTIQRRLAGEDNLPGNKFSLEALKEVFFRSDNFIARMEIDDLLALCTSTPSIVVGARTVQTGAACQALAAWDLRSDTTSRGAHVFREFWRTARFIPNVYGTPFDPADPVNTPRGLNLSDPAVRGSLLQSFGRAIAIFEDAGVAMDEELGTLQYRTLNGTRYPMSGGDEFEGVMNKQETVAFIDGQYRPTKGSGYVHMVRFKDGALTAEGLQNYGQSEDPNNPYFLTGLPKFSEHQLGVLPAP